MLGLGDLLNDDMNRRFETEELYRIIAKELGKTNIRTESRTYVPASKCGEIVEAVFKGIAKRLKENNSVLIPGFFRIHKYNTKKGEAYYVTVDNAK